MIGLKGSSFEGFCTMTGGSGEKSSCARYFRIVFGSAYFSMNLHKKHIKA